MWPRAVSPCRRTQGTSGSTSARHIIDQGPGHLQGRSGRASREKRRCVGRPCDRTGLPGRDRYDRQLRQHGEMVHRVSLLQLWHQDLAREARATMGAIALRTAPYPAATSPISSGNNIYITSSKNNTIATATSARARGGSGCVYQSDGCKVVANHRNRLPKRAPPSPSMVRRTDRSLNNTVKNNYDGIQVLSGSTGTDGQRQPGD